MDPQKYLNEHFKKIKLIHKTDSTEIWLSVDNSTNEKVAIKIMSKIGLPYEKMLDIDHPNLPKIYYAADDGCITYVVEEYLTGMNLFDYIKQNGKFDEKTVRQFAIEICSCLRELHARKILHRDIKPSNLFLTDDNVLKLIDFDIARLEKNDQTNDTEINGTPGFASPEQYGFQQTDERTDIYSLGVTLKAILNDEPNTFMSTVIDKCIEFDPSRRFQNMDEIINVLQSPIKKWLSRISTIFIIFSLLLFYAVTINETYLAIIMIFILLSNIIQYGRKDTLSETLVEWLKISKRILILFTTFIITIIIFGLVSKDYYFIPGYMFMVEFFYAIWISLIRPICRFFYRHIVSDVRAFPKVLRIDDHDPYR